MFVYILIPIVLIAAFFVYSRWAVKRNQNMSPVQAADAFRGAYSGYFKLNDGEELNGVWSGQEYQGAQGAARKVAGALLNKVAEEAVGVSKYVPNVHIGLTSANRVLVSCEYSEMGQRNNYKQIAAFAEGTKALPVGEATVEQDPGKAPRNPFNPMTSMEFVQLKSPEGETYDAWMSPQGSQIGQAGFKSILEVLV